MLHHKSSAPGNNEYQLHEMNTIMQKKNTKKQQVFWLIKVATKFHHLVNYYNKMWPLKSLDSEGFNSHGFG